MNIHRCKDTNRTEALSPKARIPLQYRSRFPLWLSHHAFAPLLRFSSGIYNKICCDQEGAFLPRL